MEKRNHTRYFTGVLGCYLEPYDGDSYVGLITRGDGSYEVIGQQLKSPLKAKECYSFNLQLAHSKSYVNYNIPIRLRVYGANALGEKGQLLCESPSITHKDWKTYKFDIFIKEDYQYIVFEAYYAKGIFTSYPGTYWLMIFRF